MKCFCTLGIDVGVNSRTLTLLSTPQFKSEMLSSVIAKVNCDRDIAGFLHLHYISALSCIGFSLECERGEIHWRDGGERW